MTHTRPKTLALISSCLLLLCHCTAPSSYSHDSSSTPPTAPATQQLTDDATLTIMTYNVNYGIAGDLDTIQAISDSGASLVLLQETTQEWEDTLRATLAHTYPHMHFAHCCGAGGLAVLSTRPFEIKAILDPPEGGWFPAMSLRAETSLGELDILQVHLRPPLSESGNVFSGYLSTRSVRELEISHYLEQLSSPPTLIVGDFNESHGKAIAHLDDVGLRSVLPELEPDQHTWRWQTSLGDITQRLDHVVYDPARLTPLTAQALDAGRSDHLPVMATFCVTPPSHREKEDRGSLSRR